MIKLARAVIFVLKTFNINKFERVEMDDIKHEQAG